VSVSDREIVTTAKLTIERHGKGAAYFAARMADELHELGDLQGARVWLKIFEAIDKMLAAEPGGSAN